MPKFIDLTGKTFNEYTVIRRSPNRGTKVSWLCRCSCGNLREVRAQGLISGTQKSCGHGLPEIQRKRQCIEYGLAAKHSAYRNYKTHAKKKKLEFDLDFDTFILMASSKCYYCGASPKNIQKGDNGDYCYQGIDRKDNSKGYTIENVVPCCEICNKAKRHMTYSAFLAWIKRISENHIWTMET